MQWKVQIIKLKSILLNNTHMNLVIILIVCCFVWSNIDYNSALLEIIVDWATNHTEINDDLVHWHIYEDFGARSRYIRQGEVIASHRILWDAINNPCLRYLLLEPKSPYMSPGWENVTAGYIYTKMIWTLKFQQFSEEKWMEHTMKYNVATDLCANSKMTFNHFALFHNRTKFKWKKK